MTGATDPASRAAVNWHRAVESLRQASGETLGPCPGPGSVAGHSNSGDHSLTHAQGQVLKDTAVSRDSVSAAEAADLFGASAANSAPSMIDRRAVDGRTWSAFAKNCLRPQALDGLMDGDVRVSVLVRSAHGVPEDCRTYVKVSCGGKTHKTPFLTGTVSPQFSQLFTFDVNDPDQAALVLKVKHDKPFSPTNPPLGRATLPLSKVSSRPELYAEPHRLSLSIEGLTAMPAPPGVVRELEVQVFLSSRSRLAALAGTTGSLNVLAATWNVGNALPPHPEQLRALWLRGTEGAGDHHLVVVSAQECSYHKSSRQARASSNNSTTLALAREGSTQPEAGAAESSGGGGGRGGGDGGNSSGDGGGCGDGGGGSGSGPDRSGGLVTLMSAPSVGTSQSVAAAAAHQALDTTYDEDDDETVVEEGDMTGLAPANGKEAARAKMMSSSKSLRGIIAKNIDSASAWEAHISDVVGPRYWLVCSEHMFQTRLLLFARMDVVPFIQDLWSSYEATGLGRIGLNKGGVGISLRIGGTQLAFVGSHLAAHQSECKRRNQDVAEITQELCPPGFGRANIVTGPHHIVWMGDLNYRVDWGQQATTQSDTPTSEDHAAMVALVQAQDYAPLLAGDQLAREMRGGRVFPGFKEAPVCFPPTFKVLKGEPGLAYGAKRSPAWCDRVLVRSNLPHKAAQLGAYWCCPEITTSDHKPVAATMQLPLVAPPMLPAERPKPFQLYLSSVRLVGEDTWKGLVQLIDDRLLSQGGDKLRLMVSGSALPGSDREYQVALDTARVRAGCEILATNLVNITGRAPATTTAGAEAAAEREALQNLSLLQGEASIPLTPTSLAIVRDAKLLIRLAVKEGFHMHTVAHGVMPLNSAAVDFASRRFKPSGVAVDLETPDGKRVGVLGVELQMLTSNRTRSIVADAVRRMRLMAAISSNQRALSRAASASAMQPKTIAKSGEAASRSASHT